jgi:hypothetical protein
MASFSDTGIPFADLMIKRNDHTFNTLEGCDEEWSLDLETEEFFCSRVHIRFDQKAILVQAPTLAFHAREDWTDDMLFIYVTPDEGLHGRVATVTNSGESMDYDECHNLSRRATFLMVSDSRVTPDRLSALIESWNMVAREREGFHASVAHLISTWSPAPSSPDMSRLFIDAPAPVHASIIKGVVAFAGGNVVVVDATSNEPVHTLVYGGVMDDTVERDSMLLRQAVSESGILTDPGMSQACARIFISQSTLKTRPPHNWIIRQMDGVLHILLVGVPLLHVTALSHTINEAIHRHFVGMDGRQPDDRFLDDAEVENFEFLLYATRINQEHLAEEACAVARRQKAGETIARMLGPLIQAHVWRPGGRLAARLSARFV